MAYRSDSQEEAFDYLFKLVLIGDAGVGKTCVVQRFMGSAFVERHSSTIGVDFTMRTVVIDGKRVKVLYVGVTQIITASRLPAIPQQTNSRSVSLPTGQRAN